MSVPNLRVPPLFGVAAGVVVGVVIVAGVEVGADVIVVADVGAGAAVVVDVFLPQPRRTPPTRTRITAKVSNSNFFIFPPFHYSHPL
jgi:hypothetical protein